MVDTTGISQISQISPTTLCVIIILAIFASTGFWSFITGRFQRKDKKEDDQAKQEDEMKEVRDWQDGATKRHDQIDHDIKGFKEELSLQSQMLRGLGHDKIILLGEKYIHQGYVTPEEYEDMYEYIYKPYRALGGNGTAEKIMNEVRDLPSHPPEVAGQ